MDINKFLCVTGKYKKCPKCKASWKTYDLKCQMINEEIEISCTCGFNKRVDENNKEIII